MLLHAQSGNQRLLQRSSSTCAATASPACNKAQRDRDQKQALGHNVPPSPSARSDASAASAGLTVFPCSSLYLSTAAFAKPLRPPGTRSPKTRSLGPTRAKCFNSVISLSAKMATMASMNLQISQQQRTSAPQRRSYVRVITIVLHRLEEIAEHLSRRPLGNLLRCRILARCCLKFVRHRRQTTKTRR